MLPLIVPQDARESCVVERGYPLIEEEADFLNEVVALPPPPIVPGFARDTIPCPPPDPDEPLDEGQGW